jgi:hypothetical protein
VELRGHQEKALEKLDNGKILWGGVGTGKSFTAVKYYERKEAPRDVYVITTAKKRDSLDWEREFAHIGVGKEQSVSGRLVVDSWNNLQRYINTTGAFFIFDEQRLVGSGAWVKAFIKLARRNHWILLSATPGDTWLDYVPVFVANGYYPNRTEFKREHVVYNTFAKFPKIDRYVGVGRLARLRAEVLIEMPYVRETLRNVVDVVVPFDAELLERVTKQRWNVYENRPLKDVGELYRVARQVVNSDPGRLAKVAELVRTHPKTIIFYNFDYELELLRSLWTPEKNSLLNTSTAEESSYLSTFTERPSLPAVAETSKQQRPEEEPRSLWKTSTTIGSSTGAVLSEKPSGSMESLSVRGRTALAELNSQKIPEEERSLWTGRSSPLTSISNDASLSGSPRTANAEANSSWLDLASTAPVKDQTSSDSSNITKDATTWSISDTAVAERSEAWTSLISSPSTNPANEFERSESKESFSGVALAEWNGHKHQRIPLEHDRWVYLVQYTAGAEGWNCTETDTMIFYSLTYSYKAFHQAQGRIDRLNTPYRHLTYYVLGGKSWIDLAVRKSLREKRDFQERVINF